jgi:hypothetical protein
VLLYRATPDNWFVINDGTPKPSVVLGVSGSVLPLASRHACPCIQAPNSQRQPITVRWCACHSPCNLIAQSQHSTLIALLCSKPHELVHLEAAAARHVPLIKRFTGGGTGAPLALADGLLADTRSSFHSHNRTSMLSVMFCSRRCQMTVSY